AWKNRRPPSPPSPPLYRPLPPSGPPALGTLAIPSVRSRRMDARTMRRNFAAGLLFGWRVVWPVLLILLVAIVALGLLVGLLEGWSVHESIYFAFVSGLTIGYG